MWLAQRRTGTTMNRCGNACGMLIGSGTIVAWVSGWTPSLPPGTAVSIDFGTGVGG